MAQLEMYPPIINSPTTQLANAIDSTTTSIEVVDGARLPDAPNICTIGRGENPETILYATKSGNVLGGITRGFQGTAQAWQAGTQVARLFTAYDLESLQQNHKTHLAESVSEFVSATRDLSILGTQTINLATNKKPKKIEIIAVRQGSELASFGGYSEVGGQYNIRHNGQDGSNGQIWAFTTANAIRFLSDDTTQLQTRGSITNAREGAFDINWTTAGAGEYSGTAQMAINILYHGG